VSAVVNPSATGMSSETLLFTASWEDEGEPRAGSFVARVAPDQADVPVFPVYDLEAQYRVMELVGARSDIAVPRLCWLELDAKFLGAPFFVMERIDGRVPPDVMPYTMGSWVTEATAAERRHLQESTVAVLASLHAIDLRGGAADFLDYPVPGDTALRRHVEQQRRYYDWVRGERRFPLLERGFAWLEENWPQAEGEAVLNWGDARIGNILYDGFEPAAVLDWEMAALAPREVDLPWQILLHVIFQDNTQRLEMPGLPDFLRRDAVSACYERLSGYRPRDLDFYEVYAALRQGVIMARIHARAVHFDEAEWPDDVDSVIHHRDVLAATLEGRFRS
jgi:aminoglycoside phosphotransferase (APT) family kinase protein